MEIKTFQEYVNYIGIYGSKTVSQMKGADDQYKKYSYDELKRNAKLVSVYLERVKHIGKGGFASIYSENRPEWMMAYFGIVYNGVWAVPLDARLTDREVKNLVLDCGVRVMFLSKSCYENLIAEPELISHIQEFIIFDPNEEMLKNKKIKSFESIMEEGRKYELKDHPVKPQDVASLIYTSGTTGKPKGVLLTHANFASQVNSLQHAVPLTSEDNQLSVLPLHHTFEFSVELAVMFKGGTETYAESLKPNKMLANVAETGVTIMVGVPLLFEKIYEGIMRNIRALPFPTRQIVLLLFGIAGALTKPTDGKSGKKLMKMIRQKAHLDKVKFMISGAAPLSQKVAQGFKILGFTLLNGYGLTESSPVVSVNRLEKKIRNETVGIPIKDVEVMINSPDVEGHGEVLVRGPNIMQGYYRNKKATDEVIDKDGWLHTGDIGKLDTLNGDQYLHITGRSKSMIVTKGGKNVYPEEIEELINNCPSVLESIVIGVPESQDSKGESIYAYIVPNYEYFDTLAKTQGFRNTEDNIEKHLDKEVREVNRMLKDYQKIQGFRIRREEFQKTSTKKIKRYLFSGKDYMNL
ncbi:MAG: AMP-binding protein [Brevinematales bacterium]|nr:AMP-binding protein [Brevinematales bacterium]